MQLDAIDAEALEAAGLPRTGRRAGSSRAASAAAAVRGMAAVGADAGAPATKKECVLACLLGDSALVGFVLVL